MKEATKKWARKKLFVVAVIFYLVSAIMLFKGYDKMTNYQNSDYPSINVNAYVGGDAYNYIINGTYATAFFVLSAGFMITGTIFLSSGLFIGIKKGEVMEENYPALKETVTATIQTEETTDNIAEGDEERWAK